MSDLPLKSILIIDDSPENIKVLAEVVKQHYKVLFATDGLKGFKLAKSKKPDLIMLDIMMEPMNGYDVCKRLKLDMETSEIPVIFLTAVSEFMDEAKGFEVGGVDYIMKPFVPFVVLARIKNQINHASSLKELKRLYNLALDSNPITQLPGNNSIRNYISLSIENREKRTVFYADLDNFKAYNDVYGFANGDMVILAVSKLFKETAEEIKIEDIFIGHIGGDDFVLSLPNTVAMNYIQTFIKNFDVMIKDHYHQEDLQRGYIRKKNRQNEEINFPIMTVSIAGVDLEKCNFGNYLQLSDMCTFLKQKAKQEEKSNCLMNRRGIQQ